MVATTTLLAAWSARADELTRWTWHRLVNRVDAWGGYCDNGTLTRPAVASRGRIDLTTEVIRQHFCATARQHIVGLHSGSRGPSSTAKWVAADIDRHTEADDAESNFDLAARWFGAAREIGFRPLLIDSNGNGGYHLSIIFERPIPLAVCYSFGRWLFGSGRVEVFPKQAALTAPGTTGQYGNWLRLPGRHHKRDHWSRAWDGQRWLSGGEAIELILATEGDDPGQIPAEARVVQSSVPKRERLAIVIPGRITAFAAAALRNECQRVVSAPSGGRNIALNRAAYALGRFVGSGELDRPTVETALRDAARNAGLNAHKTEATIRSGVDAGFGEPRGGAR